MDLLTESVCVSGFLEGPLVLPLDSTERQQCSHVIRRGRSDDLYCWLKCTQKTQIFVLTSMLWSMSCPVTVTGFLQQMADHWNRIQTRLLFPYVRFIWGFLGKHFFLKYTTNKRRSQMAKLMSWCQCFRQISQESPQLRSSVFAAMPSRRPHQTAAMTFMKTSLTAGNLGHYSVTDIRVTWKKTFNLLNLLFSSYPGHDL